MRTFLLVSFLIGGITFSYGQTTLYHTEPDALFRKGYDLLTKSEYAAARETFEEYLAQGTNQLKRTEAEYYRAFSALSLFHQDGEKLVENFIHNHPSHPKASVAYYELGDFYYKQKEYTKAIEYLTKANFQALSPDQRTTLLFELGYSHFTKRQFEQALTSFNKLKSGNSAYSAPASYYAGYIEYEQGKYDQAIADLDRAGQNPAYENVVPGMIVSIYYNQRRYDDVIAYSEKALKGNTRVNEKDFYLLTADSYLFKEDYQKAADFYDRYQEQNSNPAPPVRYRIGFADYKLGDDDSAIEEFKRAASEKDSIGIYASYYLGVLYLKQGNKLYALNAFDNARKGGLGPELTEESTYQYAKVAYDLGRTEEAINVMNAFTEEYTNSSHLEEVNDLLSKAYLNSNNYNLAISHIEKMPQVNRNLQGIYQKATYLKGAEEFNKENYQEAISLFQKSLKYTPDPQYAVLANHWIGEAYSVGRRFEEAIPYYQKALAKTAPEAEAVQLQARYGLGYAYFNTKAYDQALAQFRSYTDALRSATNKQFYTDALLRVGDSYYVNKQYDDALKYYREAIRENTVDKDYAHLQAGVMLGILGRVDEAGKEYNTLTQNYPDSRYVDDALYQRGQLNFEKGNFDAAVRGFNELIAQRPNSQYVPFAYLRRGAAHYNLQNYDKTIADYAMLLNKYSTHPVASEALLPLQEVLNTEGRTDEFEGYLVAYKQANPDKEGLESIEFETARNHYYNLAYQKTIDSFKKYISSYPRNPKVPEAKYFIAESHYRLGEFDKALPVYESLTDNPGFEQYNRVISRLAELRTAGGNYDQAIQRYYQLEKMARNKKEQFNAWSGLMEAYYSKGTYDSVTHYANTILEKGNVNISAQNKASLYLGKAAYARGDMAGAQDEFLSTLNNARDQYGAEAQYLLGESFYREKKYQQSIETLINLSKNFSAYENWVGESYLLLADNYVALDDYFQARGTLTSLVENFPGEEIKARAKAKLDKINAMEKPGDREVVIGSDSLNTGN
jgi:tetratricopeptide (TPR) repeat protein